MNSLIPTWASSSWCVAFVSESREAQRSHPDPRLLTRYHLVVFTGTRDNRVLRGPGTAVGCSMLSAYGPVSDLITV